MSCAALVFAVILMYSCDQPISLKLDLTADNININVPSKLGSFDLASILNDVLADSLPEGARLYDMKDYNNVQTFLIAYEMEIPLDTDELDFMDQIRDLMEPMKESMDSVFSELIPVKNKIEVPSMTPNIQPDTIMFDLSQQIGDVKDSVSDTFTPAEADFVNVYIGLPVYDVPGYDRPAPPDNYRNEFSLFSESDHKFKVLVIDDGTIRFEFSLAQYQNQSLNDKIDLSLTGIMLKTQNGGQFGVNRNGKNEVRLNNDNGYRDYIDIDFIDNSISDMGEIHADDPPGLVIGSIVDNYFVEPYDFVQVSFVLVVESEMNDFNIIGVRGLEFSDIQMDNAAIPDGALDAISLSNTPPQLLDALIEKGSISINVSLPGKEANHILGQPYCENMIVDFEFEIYLMQDSNDEPIEGYQTRIGLGEMFLKNQSGPGDTFSLNGRYINREELYIDKTRLERTVTIREANPGQGVNLMLFDQVFLPVTLSIDMKISEFKTIRWDLDNEGMIPEIDDTSINFANIDNDGLDLTKFVNSITFKPIEFDFLFAFPPNHPEYPERPNDKGLPEALENRLAIIVSCPELGFDNKVEFLNNGSNPITNGHATKLNLNEHLHIINDQEKYLHFDIKIVPVHNINGVATPVPDAKYIELGPLIMNEAQSEPLYVYGVVQNINFNEKWEIMEINLRSALEYAEVDPKIIDDGENFPEEYINLSDMLQYLSGFTLNDVEAKIYLDLPDDFLNMINQLADLLDDNEPTLKFTAMWKKWNGKGSIHDDDNWSEINEPEILFNESLVGLTDKVGNFPVLPNGLTYTGRNMPEGGITFNSSFIDVLASMPKELRFNYKIDGLGEFINISHEFMDQHMPETLTITPEILSGESNEDTMKALVLIKLPLSLRGGNNSYIALGDLFGGGDSPEDLFGRESPDDPLFLDGLNIKSLKLIIQFTQPFLSGGRLHLDYDEPPNMRILGASGLLITPENDNRMELDLNESTMKTIRSKLVYPNIRLDFPTGTALRIPRNPSPSRIILQAGGSYTIEEVF